MFLFYFYVYLTQDTLGANNTWSGIGKSIVATVIKILAQNVSQSDTIKALVIYCVVLQ